MVGRAAKGGVRGDLTDGGRQLEAAPGEGGGHDQSAALVRGSEDAVPTDH